MTRKNPSRELNIAKVEQAAVLDWSVMAVLAREWVTIFA
jgi:hypothetical protein